MKLTDLDPTHRIFALFKGDPKTGKDIAACSFAVLGPLYSFDLDARMESVADYYTNRVPRPDILQNIEYDRYEGFYDIHKKLQELKENCPYKTIVMSSLTSLCRKTMNTMLLTRNPSDKAKNKDRGGIPMSMIEDFGGEANGIMLVLDALLVISIKFNVNVIMTAHVINPDPGAYSKRTLLTGGKKIAGEIPTQFNEAYHFYVVTSGGIEMGANDVDRRFVCTTQAFGSDWACSALGLPDKIDFTNDVFYELIQPQIVQSWNNKTA